MAFLIKGEFFKGYTNAVAVIVHVDRVSVFGVRNEKGKGEVWASGHETIEGGFGGDDAGEKIVFNCHKALEGLMASHKEKPTHLFFALSPALCRIGYATTKAAREDKEKKITQSEFALVTEKPYGAEAREIFRNVPQRFFVDEFLVSDPIGMNGAELTVGMTTLRYPRSLDEAFGALASAWGMNYAGTASIPFACMEACAARSDGGDALAVFVFEEGTALALIRAGVVANSGFTPVGYGILVKKASIAFGVGEQEALAMIRVFREGTLPVDAADSIKNTVSESLADLSSSITRAVAALDKDNLLPGTIFTGVAADFPELDAWISDPAWTAALPIERAASVRRIAHGRESFDRSFIDFLIL